jgi:pimeloyl-ACP methyl ester carboxylesterase
MAFDFSLNNFASCLIFFLLSSCSNPTASIHPDIETFTKNYPANFGFVTSNNRTVHYTWSGDRSKRPLVFVHGSPGSWQGWAHFLVNKDLQKNFFIIALDRLGFGESGRGLTEPSLQKQAHAVLEVLKLSSHRAILVGHSFGGPVIAGAAMLDPQKIAGLIFVASSVSPELEKTKWIQYPASWWPIKFFIPTELRVCNEEILPLKNELLKQKNFWPSIQSRIAIIHGIDDQLVPIQNVDFLSAHLKKEAIILVEKIPRQGHFVPWERPDSIMRAIELVNASLID